jgi:hypothetical protein
VGRVVLACARRARGPGDDPGRLYVAEATAAGQFLWAETEAACRDLAAGVWNGEDRVCD